MFTVVEHFREIGKDGFLICRFRLQKISVDLFTSPQVSQSGYVQPLTTARQQVTMLRMVRDSNVSRQVKGWYNYTCQICSIQIGVRGVLYAGGAHIKPLGRPRNGVDNSENMLCLCPNHHVMLDKGVFSISTDYSLLGLNGLLQVHHRHQINLSNFLYHQQHIYTDDR